MASDFYVRPMAAADLPEVERLTGESFHEMAVRTRRADLPHPEPRSAGQSAAWLARLGHFLTTDPRGCWVAEDDRRMLGAAVGMRRELLWVLSVLAVRPGLQGRGVGRQLMAAAAGYGAGALRWMVSASDDPLALRTYRRAGFSLHPLTDLHGRVERSALPVVDGVREGSAGDVDLMDSVDRQVRGAAHGPDHRHLTGAYPLVVADSPRGTGYAYLAPVGGPTLLAATNRRTATSLLWETLAASSPDIPVQVRKLTPVNEWALDVALACRLTPFSHGYLGLRDMRPPAPYLPSAHVL